MAFLLTSPLDKVVIFNHCGNVMLINLSHGLPFPNILGTYRVNIHTWFQGSVLSTLISTLAF